MPQRAALVVPHWIVFGSAHVPFCVHRVVQLPPRSTWMLEFVLFNIFLFHSKTCHWCYLTTGATLAPQLNTELVSWARAERLRVTSNEIAYIRRGMMRKHTWGSPHNSNPKWPFAVGLHKGVMIAGKLSQRLCPPPGMIKEMQEMPNDWGRNFVWRPQRFQTGGTRHGARRLPGTRFLVDLEKVKIFQEDSFDIFCQCQPITA